MELFNESKKIIESQVTKGTIFNSGQAFSKYQKVYLWTNENIKEYLEQLNLVDEKALSVMASGDHVFNLITKGIKNIDTFDTNTLTEYFALGLKRAMILKYDYNTFIKTIEKISNTYITLEEITTIIKDLLPFMDKEHRHYWDIISEFNYKIQKGNDITINIIHMLFINICKEFKERNNYLTSEESYNKLKSNLQKSNITFKNISAIDLDKNYNKQYKYILLSNILDYFYKVYGYNWTKTNLDEFIKKLSKLTDKDTITCLNYIFMYSSDTFKRTKLISNSNISNNDLDNSEILLVNNVKNNIKDGIILMKHL